MPRKNHRGLIVSSIFISLAFHAALLFFLWQMPYKSYSPPLGFKKEESNLIREALEDMVVTQNDETISEPLTIIKNEEIESTVTTKPPEYKLFGNVLEKNAPAKVLFEKVTLQSLTQVARPDTSFTFHPLVNELSKDLLAEELANSATPEEKIDETISTATEPLSVSEIAIESSENFSVQEEVEISYETTSVAQESAPPQTHSMPQELIDRAFSKIEKVDFGYISAQELEIYQRNPEKEQKREITLEKNRHDITLPSTETKTLPLSRPNHMISPHIESSPAPTEKPQLPRTFSETPLATPQVHTAVEPEKKLAPPFDPKAEQAQKIARGVTDYTSLVEIEQAPAAVNLAKKMGKNDAPIPNDLDAVKSPKHLSAKKGQVPVDRLASAPLSPKVLKEKRPESQEIATKERPKATSFHSPQIATLSEKATSPPAHVPFDQYDDRDMLGELTMVDETLPEKKSLPANGDSVAQKTWNQAPPLSPQNLSLQGEAAAKSTTSAMPDSAPHLPTKLARTPSIDVTHLPKENSSSLIISAQEPSVIASPIKDMVPTAEEATALNRSKRQTRHNLSGLPTLVELDTLSLQEDFYTKVSMGPMRSDGTRLFAVELHPRDPERIETMSQNYTFLIDRSGSIEKHRFKSFCDGVIKSLSYLKETDTFNILLFDNGITKMSNHSLYATPSSIKSAKRFLSAQEKGLRFSTPNVYGLLVKMGEVAAQSPMYNSVFLLTNGKSLEHISARDKNFKTFFQSYRGGFSLFTAAAGHGNNNNTLEFLAKMSKGRHLYSQTHAGFPRKFAALVKTSQQVVASHIQANVSKAPEGTEITLLSKENDMPNLHTTKPLVIHGQVKQPRDFEMILQGKVGTEWINVRLPISLTDAEKQEKSLEKELSLFKALEEFDNSLEEGKIANLEETQDLIQSLR